MKSMRRYEFSVQDGILWGCVVCNHADCIKMRRSWNQPSVAEDIRSDKQLEIQISTPKRDKGK